MSFDLLLTVGSAIGPHRYLFYVLARPERFLNMSARYYLLLILFFVLVAAIAWPLGRYMARVFAGTNAFGRKIGGPIERVLYRLAGVDPSREQTWKGYALAVLAFSLLTQLITYVMLRCQDSLPLNPGQAGRRRALAVVQHGSQLYDQYQLAVVRRGETTMSYLSQAVALTSHNFFSAAVGIAVAIAMIRGLSRHETDKDWQFLGRFGARQSVCAAANLCLLRVILVSQGVIQNVAHPTTWTTLDGTTQTIMQGPVASQEANQDAGHQRRWLLQRQQRSPPSRTRLRCATSCRCSRSSRSAAVCASRSAKCSATSATAGPCSPP